MYVYTLSSSYAQKISYKRNRFDWFNKIAMSWWEEAACTMASFYLKYQKASVFCFLVQIRAFVVVNLTRIAKFKHERKNDIDSD